MVQSNALLVDLRPLLPAHGIDSSIDSESYWIQYRDLTNWVLASDELRHGIETPAIAKLMLSGIDLVSEISAHDATLRCFFVDDLTDLHYDESAGEPSISFTMTPPLPEFLEDPSEPELSASGTILAPNGYGEILYPRLTPNKESWEFHLTEDENSDPVTDFVSTGLQSVLPWNLAIFNNDLYHSSPWESNPDRLVFYFGLPVKSIIDLGNLLSTDYSAVQSAAGFAPKEPALPKLSFQGQQIPTQLVTPNGIIKAPEVSTPRVEVNQIVARSVRRPSR